MSSVVGARGQVVIEKLAREALGVGPGHLSVQRVVGDHLEIRFFPPAPTTSLRGILAPHIHGALEPEKWDETRSQAWLEAAGEIARGDE